MAIQYVRAEDIPVKYVNGYYEYELLPGSHPAVKVYKCFLKAGNSKWLELYDDRFQIFAFTKGIGAVVSESNAYSITEEAYYIPKFNTEKSAVHAGTDMIFVRYEVILTEADRIAYTDTHMLLPSFRLHSQLLEYGQACKGPNTRSWNVIYDHELGRVIMGVVKAVGEGTDEKGHPSVDQWNYFLSDSDITLTVEGESINQKDGDFSYIVAGDDHSLIADKGKICSYIWFEYYVDPKDVLQYVIPQEYGKNGK